jgi:hypothetical protein
MIFSPLFAIDKLFDSTDLSNVFFVQDPDEKCLNILKENKICLGKVDIFSIIFRSIVCFHVQIFTDFIDCVLV